MKGVTALIISSLNGFGLNIVRQFAKQGYNIVLNGDKNDENIINTIQNDYQQCKTMYLSANIQNEIDRHKLVEQILNQFQHIDILIINNACKQHYRASIDEFPVEKWREIIDYNLISTFALVKTLWPHMKRQHFGRIINIVSRQDNSKT
jgi:NAD(P)-dependent dehydrogenase (short-subunit alcohol dehydrogenase family)